MGVLEVGSEPIRGHRLTRRLGRGGCGEVWEAARPDGRFVALKFINCKDQPSSLVSNEIRTLLRLRELRHPNMIRLFDVSATSQYIVLTMERADGSLRDLEEVYVHVMGDRGIKV